MQRQLWIRSGCAVAHLALAIGTASASHPIIGHEVELVPELSSFTVTGGFAGIHQTYGVAGSLSFFADLSPHEPDGVEAGFSTVDATLVGEGFFDGAELSDVLRMTEWRGLVVKETPLTLSFTGGDAQQAPITSVAVFSGPSLRLRGDSTPACCDLFSYSWDLFALAPFRGGAQSHADFDGDGDVDGHDLLEALTHFGAYESVVHQQGDADSDGDVDRADLTIWKSMVGSGVAMDDAGAAIPEPGTCILASLVSVILILGRKRSFQD